MALVVAGERGDRAVAVLELVVGGAEALAAPAGLEQAEQAVEAARRAPTIGSSPPRRGAHLLGVEALEHLVDQDPEALVDRRLLRDREDARELVLQRAGPVEVDVGWPRAPRPPLRRGRNCSSDGSRRAATWSRRAPRSRSSPITYSSSAEASIAIRCSGEATRPSSSLIASIASGAGSDAGPLDQRRELDQLEVAGDRGVDVVDGVEAHLRDRRARPPRRLEHLVAQHPVGRVQALGRPEQLLLVELLLAPGRLARRAVDPRRRGLPSSARSGQESTSAQARPGHRDVGEHQPPLGGQLVAGLGQRLGEQLVGDPGVLPLARGDRAAAQPEQVDVVELEPLDLLGLGDQHGARQRRGRSRRRRARRRRRRRSGGGRSRAPSRAARAATSRRPARRAARG